MRIYSKTGFQVPDVLIPGKSVQPEKWAVVACDQYSSQPEYWEKVKKIIDKVPSTYHLILPEAYLGKPEETRHLSQINGYMADYLQKHLFMPIEGLIYIERTLGPKVRKGLIAALDLDKYDFHKDSQSLIRATEGTIVERLPPRIKIRENAPLEIPHILVLIDDPRFTVIEPLAELQNSFENLYDFELMMGGGNLKGFLIKDPQIEKSINSAILALADSEMQHQKYQNEKAPLLFAVGDGNHSLATAKSIWENMRASVNAHHPARFALVEIVNIHNDGIQFEPIHRILKNMQVDIFEAFSSYFSGKITYKDFVSFEGMIERVKNQSGISQIVGSSVRDKFRTITIEEPKHTLPMGSLQLFLDDLISIHQEIELDFIHGEDALKSLASEPNSIGFYLPAMEKSSLFASVIKDGPLPRKTFSMGEAYEKRFYFECRKIQAAD